MSSNGHHGRATLGGLEGRVHYKSMGEQWRETQRMFGGSAAVGVVSIFALVTVWCLLCWWAALLLSVLLAPISVVSLLVAGFTAGQWHEKHGGPWGGDDD